MRASNLSDLLQRTSALAESLRESMLCQAVVVVAQHHNEVRAANSAPDQVYADLLIQLGQITVAEHADHKQGPAARVRDLARFALETAKIRYGWQPGEPVQLIQDQVDLLDLAEQVLAEAQADDEDRATSDAIRETW